MMNCKDASLSHVKSAETSHTVWKTFADMYDVKTMGRILALQRELHTLSFSSFPSLFDFIAKIKDLWDDLANCGKTYSSEDMAGLLLFKLPNRFDAF